MKNLIGALIEPIDDTLSSVIILGWDCECLTRMFWFDDVFFVDIYHQLILLKETKGKEF